MRIKTSVACFFFSAIILCLSSAAEDDSQTVPLQDLPSAVQTAIKRQLGTATLGEVEREGQGEEIIYTVTLTCPDGEESYFTLDHGGSLLSVEVQLKDLVPALQQAIKSQLGSGTLTSIEKSIDEGEVNYDIAFTRKDGAERSFTLDSKGTLTSVQLGMEEVPAIVRKVIEEHSTQGKPGEIYKLIDDGEVSYSIELQQGKKNRELAVTASGKVESMQKFMHELPGPAQKTIREQVGAGKILRIDKSFERLEGVEPFRVEARKDGKLFIFNVGPKGRYLGQDN